MPERFWEIDFARGVAVVLMIVFNYAFALRYLGVYSLDAGWLFWWLFPRTIAGMFILLAGLSLSISYSRLKNKREAYIKYLFRGAKIFSLGLLITLATWPFPGTIFFGILHFLGLTIILSPLFLRWRSSHLLVASVASIVIGIYFQSLTTGFPWLLWLGFIPENFFTLDHFPLFPWIGLFFLGVYSGNGLYRKGKRTFRIRQIRGSAFVRMLGRRSLLIYLLHQPSLILILSLLGYRIF